MKMLCEGDIVMLFGSKVKLKIKKEQSTSNKMTGINAKDKDVNFVMSDISKIIREGKQIYHAFE